MGFAQEFLASAPSSSFGYYRGTPYYGGEGSGGGQRMAGNNAFAQGQGPTTGAGGWEPHILYLFGFIVLEMVVFGFLASKL